MFSTRYNWYIYNNTLSTSFLKFFVSMTINNNDIELKVFNEDMQELTVIFLDLESALRFAENTISSCETLDDVNNKYIELYYDKNRPFC